MRDQVRETDRLQANESRQTQNEPRPSPDAPSTKETFHFMEKPRISIKSQKPPISPHFRQTTQTTRIPSKYQGYFRTRAESLASLDGLGNSDRLYELSSTNKLARKNAKTRRHPTPSRRQIHMETKKTPMMHRTQYLRLQRTLAWFRDPALLAQTVRPAEATRMISTSKGTG